MLESIAPELVILILQYLPAAEIAQLERLSQTWKDFIDTNESTIFRNAAVHHGYIHLDVHQSFEDAHASRSLRGVDGWKSFCKPNAS
jgi:hypothetical protein